VHVDRQVEGARRHLGVAVLAQRVRLAGRQ
jgi:hypothetical protein